jgi:hypothetical protein
MAIIWKNAPSEAEVIQCPTATEILDTTIETCQEAQRAMQRLVVQLAVLANNRNIPPKIGNMASLLWRWACTEKECVEQIRSELIDLNKKEVF